MGESVIASDSLAFNTSRDTHVGTWWIETVIVGTEQDPAPFLKILQGAASTLHSLCAQTCLAAGPPPLPLALHCSSGPGPLLLPDLVLAAQRQVRQE